MFERGSTLTNEWMTLGIPGLDPSQLDGRPEALLDAAVPGPDLGAAIDLLAPTMPVLGGAGWEAMLAGIRRQEARLAALKLEAANGLAQFWADRPTNPGHRKIADEQAGKFAAGSVGATLNLPFGTAFALVERAARLQEDFPRTLRQLKAGIIDEAHARVIVEELSLSALSEEFRADIEDELLEKAAAGATAKALRKLAAKRVAQADPAAARRRREARIRERDVITRDEGDGMASLKWTDQADRIHAAHRHLQDTAAAQDPDDDRSAHERRADAAADLFGVGPASTDQIEPEPDEEDWPPFPFDPDHDAIREGREAEAREGFDPNVHPSDDPHRDRDTVGAGKAGGSHDRPGSHDHPAGGQPGGQDSGQGESAAHDACAECADGAIATTGQEQGAGKVAIHVDLLTLQRMRAGALEARDGAVYFEGVGWIDTELAKALLKTAKKAEVLVTDLDGQCIYASEDQQYTPKAWHERTVEHAHRVCRFPGCRLPAKRCDLDHREEHAGGGATCPHNLQPLCRTHHNMKTHGGWTVRPLDPQRPSGDLIWTSPFGRRSLDRLEEPLFVPRQRRGFGGDQEAPPF